MSIALQRQHESLDSAKVTCDIEAHALFPTLAGVPLVS